MRKHFFVASSFVLAFVGATLYSRQEERKDTFNEIRVKMSKSEVRRLLGATHAQPGRSRKLAWGGIEELWLGRDGTILVAFKDDVLTYKEWIEPEAMIHVGDISE